MLAANYTFATGTTAVFTITSGSISGNVNYLIVPKPVPGVTLDAPGTPPVSGTTNSLGNYLLSGFGGGAYTVTPSRPIQACGINNGIMANDASMVSQYVVSLITLTPAQQAAAKVSGNLTPALSSFDAALIAQRVVCISNVVNLAGQWKFTPASVPHPLGVVGSLTENYDAYMMGDVDGNWNPAVFPNRPSQLTPSSDAVTASVAVVAAAPGSQVTIPFRIDNLQGKTVGSYQFDIEYDPTVIEPGQVAATIAGTMSSGLSVVSNAPTPGLLKVAIYGVLPVGGDGVYANLRFTVLGGVGSSTPLTINGFTFNNGSDEVTSIGGQLTVVSSTGNASVSGRILSTTGRPVRNARVTLTSTTGASISLATGSLGTFEFSGLAVGETYTVSVVAQRFTFTPRMVSVAGEAVFLDIIAEP